MNKGADWDYVRSRLQKAYDLALSATDDFGFYINLINYVAIFDQITELQKFIKTYITKTAEKDHKLLKKYEAEIIKETLILFEKVKPYLDQNKIETTELSEYVKNLPLINEGKILTSDGKMKSMFGNLNRILYITWGLEEGKHKDFLKQFGKIDNIGNIRWEIMEKHDEYDVEEMRLNRVSFTKIWYYWDKLAFFYNLFIEYEKMSKEWYEKRSFMYAYGLAEAYGEIRQIFNLQDPLSHPIKPEKPYFFTKEAMFNALKQFHYHFLETIDLIKKQKQDKVLTKYNNKQQELTIKDQTIKFSGKRANLLSLLFKENREIYFDEALQHIEGIDTESCTTPQLKSYKKNFINYCDGINSRVAENGYTNFLFADANSVSINPLYR